LNQYISQTVAEELEVLVFFKLVSISKLLHIFSSLFLSHFFEEREKAFVLLNDLCKDLFGYSSSDRRTETFKERFQLVLLVLSALCLKDEITNVLLGAKGKLDIFHDSICLINLVLIVSRLRRALLNEDSNLSEHNSVKNNKADK
jgi:hypothetical protein